jgi:hypothetical protein
MLLHEYDDDAFEEFDIDKPIEGFCFWVLTEFNLAHRSVRARKIDAEQLVEPNATATHPEAMDMADDCAEEIQKKFRGSTIRRIDPEFRQDEFHLYIVDKTNMPIAKIGVVAEDYRHQTIH